MDGSVIVETCPQCGAPVKLNANKCEYCGSEFLITSLAYLNKFDQAGINKYINHYSKLLKKNPENGEVNLAIGICYLDIGMYDLAIKFFSKAVELIPEYADVYYYYALALIKGRKPKVLSLNEVKKIEGYINTAIQIDNTKSTYYFLWALIKYDFYMKHGLKVNPPTLEELIEEGETKYYDKQEMDKMLQRVPVNDEKILSRIRK